MIAAGSDGAWARLKSSGLTVKCILAEKWFKRVEYECELRSGIFALSASEVHLTGIFMTECSTDGQSQTFLRSSANAYRP